MRHAFSFPIHIREAVKEHVRQAIAGINPGSFQQEPAYVSALLARLVGTAYEGPDGSVAFRTTSINAIARNAAERWSGADLAITADISNGKVRVSKAILAQAKLGKIEELSTAEARRLVGQIQELRGFTRSPKVLMIHEIDGRREPTVASGIRIADDLPTQALPLADYFVRRLLTTLDGDTRPRFVAAVQESSLEQLRVLAELSNY